MSKTPLLPLLQSVAHQLLIRLDSSPVNIHTQLFTTWIRKSLRPFHYTSTFLNSISQNVTLRFTFQVSRRYLPKTEKVTWNIFEDGINIKMTTTFCLLFLKKWNRYERYEWRNIFRWIVRFGLARHGILILTCLQNILRNSRLIYGLYHKHAHKKLLSMWVQAQFTKNTQQLSFRITIRNPVWEFPKFFVRSTFYWKFRLQMWTSKCLFYTALVTKKEACGY